RNLRVGPVKLIDVDPVDAETLEAALAGGAQMLGTSVRGPAVGTRPLEPTLGGDHQLVGVGVERFGDQALADLGSVGVGGVDQVDAQLEGAAQHALALFTISRF